MIARLRQVARNARKIEGQTKGEQVFEAMLGLACLSVMLLNLVAWAGMMP